jgi:rhamnopyranosyl-N-acetylglucosaminyl-diphospho-decaprenol beta-1,3/1,4-galactofuranosyltransferase
MEKIIAVVVTYNRQNLLCECIDALRNQTRKPDAILVVNNGSTDNTEQWLQQQPDLFFISQKNIGAGGGFGNGLKWAFKNNYTWMWCMDDDGYPQANALKNLIANACEDLKLYNCAVINKADKKSFVWRTGQYSTIDEVNTKTIEGIGHPFNGTFIHRKIIERVGTPKPKYFLWGDETEYYYRITKKNNIPVCTVTDSIHYHPASAFSYKNDWDYTSGWKMYFYIRNRFDIHRAKFGNPATAIINYAAFLAALAGIVMVYQKTDRLKKLGFILWPAADALRSNFSATPLFILERLKTKSEKSFTANLINTVKTTWSVLFTPSAVRKMQTR